MKQVYAKSRIIVLMIHSAFKLAEIAFRYYSIKYPEKGYDREAARKQFRQEREYDRKLLRQIFDTIHKEQIDNLKS